MRLDKFILIVLILLVLPTVSAEVTVLSQRDISGGVLTLSNGAGTLVRGNSFRMGVDTTINQTVLINKLSMNFTNYAGGNIIIHFQYANASRLPNGTEVANITISSGVTNNQWKNFTLTNPGVFYPGVTYAMFADLASTGVDTSQSAASTLPLGVVIRNNGAGWFNDSITVDLAFELFGVNESVRVELLSPSNQATTIASTQTFNASAMSINGSLVNATLYLWNSTNLFNSTTINLITPLGVTNYSYFTVNDIVVGNYTWNIKACSTSACAFAPTNRTFINGIIVNDVNFTQSVYDTSNAYFRLNITVNGTLVNFATATLYYNGTAYTTTKTEIGDTFIFERNISIPPVTATSTKQFYYSVFISDTTVSGTFLTSTYNQTVNPIEFQRCGTGYTAVNYTIYDESTLLPITSSFIGNFLYTLDQSFTPKSYSNTTSGSNSYTFCINNNNTHYVTASIDLSKSEYASRQYILFNEQYNNDTTYRLLYLLNATASSDIVIQLKDAGQQPLAEYGAKIYRYYANTGNYSLVEEKQTDIFGEFVIRGEENTVRYKLEFYNTANVLVETFEPVYFVCYTTRCNIPFIVRSVDNVLNDFDDIESHDYSLTFNNITNIWVLAWTDTTGDTNVIHRLRVTRFSANDTGTVCDTNSSSLSSSLTCSVGTGVYTYIAQAYRTSDGVSILLDSETTIVQPPAASFLRAGLFWFIIIIATITSGFVFNPSHASIVMVACTVLFAFAGVIYLPGGILILLVAMGGFFAWAFRGG